MDRLKDERFAKFYKKYLQIIAEKLEFLEQTRFSIFKEYKKSLFEYIFTFGLCEFLLIYFFISLYKTSLILSIVMCMLFIAILIWEIYTFFSLRKEYNRIFQAKFKNVIIEDMLCYVDLKSRPEYSKTDNSLIKKSKLFDNFTRDFRDDEFESITKGVPTSIIEIKLCDVLKGNRIDSIHELNPNLYDCIFSGIILTFKYNKKIKEPVVIYSKSKLKENLNSSDFIIKTIIMIVLIFLFASNILFNKDIDDILIMLFFLPVFVIFFYKRRIYVDKDIFKQITLEYSKFNKKFNVYSSDQIEARYLVTPLFMEKLYNLKTVFGTKNLKCSFFDDNLMIAIDTKRDLFELGNLFKPVKDIKTIKRFYDEITTIFDLIDYFKLNEDIYLK